jgi:large subunit ribosomal protein L29
MKAVDLREKSVEDLRELAKTLARDVFQNRLKNFTNRLDDTSAIRKAKRDHARVVTLLRERELGVVRGGAAAGEQAAPAEAKPAKKKAAATAEAGTAEAGEVKPKKSAAKKSSAKKSEAK